MILSINNRVRSWKLSLHLTMVIAATAFSLVRLQAADETQDGVIASIDYLTSGELPSAGGTASQLFSVGARRLNRDLP